MSELKDKVVKGSAWMILLRLFNRGLQALRMIMLAWVLAPSDFGVMGIVFLALGFVDALTTTGFTQALIQKEKVNKSYLNSAWTVLVIRGLLICISLFFVAPIFANFFNSPESVNLIRAIGIYLMLNGFINIGIIYLQKELEFKKQFIYELAGTLVDFIITIVIAFIFKTVWAIVIGLTVGALVRLILSFKLHFFKPKFYINKHHVQDLFKYGKWIFFANMLFFLSSQLDSVLVGKLISATILGYYTLATKIAYAATTEISIVVAKVTFPAFSKLKNNYKKLKKAYLDTFIVISFLSFSICAFLFALAPDFVRLFLGEKWMPIVIPMKIILIAGVFKSLLEMASSLFKGIGKPKYDALWQTVRLLVFIIVSYLLYPAYGLNGIAYAVLISMLLAMVGSFYHAKKVIIANYRELIYTIKYPLIIMVLVIFGIALAKNYIIGISYLNFIILFIWGLLIMFISTAFFVVFFRYDIYDILFKRVLFTFRRK